MDETMCGMGTGEWIFGLIVLLALFNGGFGGFGGNRGMFGPEVATSADVQRATDFSALERQNNEGVAATRQGVYDVTGAIKDASYNSLGEIRDIQAAIAAGAASNQECCCNILRGIDGINYNGAMNTAAINANTTAQTQKILDAICQNKIEAMQSKINALELQNAVAGVVRYPNGMTYNAGMSPFCGGCGC